MSCRADKTSRDAPYRSSTKPLLDFIHLARPNTPSLGFSNLQITPSLSFRTPHVPGSRSDNRRASLEVYNYPAFAAAFRCFISKHSRAQNQGFRKLHLLAYLLFIPNDFGKVNLNSVHGNVCPNGAGPPQDCGADPHRPDSRQPSRFGTHHSGPSTSPASRLGNGPVPHGSSSSTEGQQVTNNYGESTKR
jgi:hypothetical protein